MKHLESFPVDTQRMPVKRRLADAVLAEISLVRERFADEEKIIAACDGLAALVHAQEPVQALCQARIAMFKMLNSDTRKAVKPHIRNGAVALQNAIDTLRSTDGVRYPDVILPCEMRWCPGSPWYSLFYEHDDPERGTTGGPHVFLVRLPKPITSDGKPLSTQGIHASGQLSNGRDPIVRIHSECLLGDIFDQIRCGCGPQLDACLDAIEDHGSGGVFYHRAEGRGMGLHAKPHSLRRQEGRDVDGKWVGKVGTAEAMKEIGFPEADFRDYTWIGPVLRGVGLKQFGLLTNNRRKLGWLIEQGFDVHRVDAAEVALADRAGADGMFLSPVFPTRSHPGAACLGAEGFHALAAQAKCPVIALGGMDPVRAAELGWPRWAGIDAFLR
jgi:GTP cyclohydrolase II